jgi:two-component system, chemotaxis family, protein-glutamate methylesterase/glutaminase
VGKVRVLVVDDSVVIRRMLTDVLNDDPAIEVVGHASNGRLALQRLTQLQPDVVVMDVEMPEMNGIEALVEMRKTHKALPIIMFSTLTTHGGAATLDALARGATDYVAKPANVGSVQASIAKVREELVPKVRALGGAPREHERPALRAAPKLNRVVRAVRVNLNTSIDVLTIGVSTGGPNALAELIPALPGDLGVPVLIVQHMPPLFTKLLAERLDRESALHVVEGAQGLAVRPNTVYIAPGDFHMTVAGHVPAVRLELNQDPPENSCRPAVDVLFRSVAAVYGGHALGAVLTGMGKDGMRGSEVLTEAGAEVLAQDEASSVVWGMPGFVARAGLASAVLPLSDIAPEITRRIKRTPGVPRRPVPATR